MAQLILVEPDRVLAGIYKEALEAAGHQVIPVSGAQAAIIAADHVTPDAIILELQLIEHSGIEFLYEFRSYPEWYDIPVIIHTQVPPHEFNQNGHVLRNQLNVSTYLYKPQTTLWQLRRAVSEASAVPATP